MQEAATNVRAIIVPELLNPFSFAMFGEDSIKIDHSGGTDSWDSDDGPYDTSLVDLTEGDVASNGEVILENSADVGGDVSTSTEGGIIADATVTISGDSSSTVDRFELEPIPDEVWIDAAANNSNGLLTDPPLDSDNNLTLSSFESLTLTGGTYYFDNVILDANSSLQIAPDDTVFLYIRGDLNLYNNTTINSTQYPANCMIYSDGTVNTIGMDVDINAAFYGPNADVLLDNSCDWYGSIIAASVILENNAEVHYDQSLTEIPIETTGNMIMIAWAEE